ncbi:hypothetical protein M3221_13585 [Domibacillus indicus]|uniref:hypothetical protein n=1 Tax=Domibacillus indicus TaxID=1437523 RepID=UPI00203B9D54|nr:hypothetical protein [Domibacillus indicus]MCM3789432.1 hypothetical protein [Domibacillus indicus]
MNKLKKLQADYRAGKITEAEYTAKLQALLNEEEITQEEHDEAADFDPGDSGDEKPIYTQSDMDSAIVKKARQMVRQAMKKAGVDVSNIKPLELLDSVAELAAAGVGKEKETNTELKELRRKAAAYDELEPSHRSLTVENAVLKAAGKYNPVNPAQVVRALNADYSHLLDFDEETNALDPKSVTRAIKQIAAEEPNLFNKKPEEEKREDQGDDDLNSKPPGGAGQQQTAAEKAAAQKANALKLMGFDTPQN